MPKSLYGNTNVNSEILRNPLNLGLTASTANINGNLTVTGSTSLQGLTATTISATTYQNLPVSGLTAGNNINISGTNNNFTISFTGSTGTSGTSGSSGTSGTSGSSGTSGIDGTSGTSGVDGTSGTSGVDGTSGTSGSSGTSGTSGSSGTSGIDGTSGTSGSSGTSGIDGTSGTSGSSGTSGVANILNNVNNNILTATGTSGVISGQTNATFNGTNLSITGNTIISSGLTATTISATTYQNIPTAIQIACSDEVTVLVTGTTTTFRMPYNMLLTEVRGSLTTAQVSGSIFTVNILSGGTTGTTILSTLLTINNNEKTSKAVGTTQPVISTPNLIDDSEISVRITQIGNGTARGLKVTLIGNRLN